jgi:DNA-binding NarL/FixJ family response regulator
LNRVLFFSDNKKLITFWSSVLNAYYQIDTVSDLSADFTADVAIVDADKIIENQNLLTIFNKKTTRFLIIGTDWSEENQIKAIASGAAGYCNKTEPSNLLLQAIERILKGDIWIQRHLVSQVIGALVKMKYAKAETEANQVSKQAESSKLLLTLSSREQDVAKMICSGDSNKAIASSLFISERTVKAHLTSIFKKLSIPDRLHLALFIKEFG